MCTVVAHPSLSLKHLEVQMWFMVYPRYFYGLPVDHHAASIAALQVSQPPLDPIAQFHI